MTDIIDQIHDLIGPGNGPGCPREPRDTELLKAAMPLAVEAVTRARVALDCGATAIDMQPADIIAAGFLILSRDAIEMVAVQSTPIDCTGARAPCGWCKRAAADIEAVLALPKRTEAEAIEHVTTCQHNPLVAEVAKLTRERDDAYRHLRAALDCALETSQVCAGLSVEVERMRPVIAAALDVTDYDETPPNWDDATWLAFEETVDVYREAQP